MNAVAIVTVAEVVSALDIAGSADFDFDGPIYTHNYRQRELVKYQARKRMEKGRRG